MQFTSSTTVVETAIPTAIKNETGAFRVPRMNSSHHKPFMVMHGALDYPTTTGSFVVWSARLAAQRGLYGDYHACLKR